MAEPEKFETWDSWKARCLEKGLVGPYKIDLTRWQFVGKSGTAALWNATHNMGYVFASSDPTPANGQ